MSLGNEGIPMTMNVEPAGSANNGGWGNGMGGDWFLVLFLIFALAGGWGGGWGGGGNGATQGTITRSDLCSEFSFNDLQNGVRNINDAVNLGFANLNSTICHQQYDTAMQTNAIQSAVNSGFQSLNSTICQQQYDTAQQLNAMNMANMQNANAANVVALQNANAIQSQLANCCCENREAIAGVNYNMATQACDTRNVIQSTTRDMIDNANANTRAILDKLTSQELAAKDAQISAQNQKIFGLELAASQAAQNNYLISRLNPTPVPAYPAASPCGLGNWAPSVLAGGYGYNGGCCCNG